MFGKNSVSGCFFAESSGPTPALGSPKGRGSQWLVVGFFRLTNSPKVESDPCRPRLLIGPVGRSGLPCGGEQARAPPCTACSAPPGSSIRCTPTAVRFVAFGFQAGTSRTVGTGADACKFCGKIQGKRRGFIFDFLPIMGPVSHRRSLTAGRFALLRARISLWPRLPVRQSWSPMTTR